VAWNWIILSPYTRHCRKAKVADYIMDSEPERHRQGPYEALTASAPDAILMIDENSTILSANPATERIFGYAPHELVGRALTILMPERLRAKHDAGIERYMSTGRRNIPWTGVHLPALTKDGREVPVEISFGEFRDERGRRVFSGFVRDISDRIRQQEALAEREEALKRANAESERQRKEAEAAVESRDEMLSIVSHDLRNPVNTVAMSAALLTDPDIQLSESDRRVQLDIIARSAQRMNRLIQDLLDVARIEGGRFTVSCQCEVPGTLVSEACDAFRHVAAEKLITLGCEIAPHLPDVHVDRDRIMQALSNYLSNAIKFTPEQGHVVIGASTDGDGGVQFFVADTGPGIPAEELPRVFDRFWQARRTAHLGAGVGLAVAKGVAAAHGGRVWAESAPGKGTTFFLAVPRSARCP
jgi:PAS domain S-box-containing protein